MHGQDSINAGGDRTLAEQTNVHKQGTQHRHTTHIHTDKDTHPHRQISLNTHMHKHKHTHTSEHTHKLILTRINTCEHKYKYACTSEHAHILQTCTPTCTKKTQKHTSVNTSTHIHTSAHRHLRHFCSAALGGSCSLVPMCLCGCLYASIHVCLFSFTVAGESIMQGLINYDLSFKSPISCSHKENHSFQVQYF